MTTEKQLNLIKNLSEWKGQPLDFTEIEQMDVFDASGIIQALLVLPSVTQPAQVQASFSCYAIERARKDLVDEDVEVQADLFRKYGK